MPDIEEMLRKSELRTDIWKIACDLVNDPSYSKEDAVKALVEYLAYHNL